MGGRLTMLLLRQIGRCRGLCPDLPMRTAIPSRGIGQPSREHQPDCNVLWDEHVSHIESLAFTVEQQI